MSRGCRARGRTAFTLVELLVVIGVVSILLAVLMPTLASARRRTQTLVCSNNMRSILQAAHCYAADYGGRVPRDKEDANAPYLPTRLARYLSAPYDWASPPEPANPYHDHARYIERLKVFTCPALPETEYKGLNDGWQNDTGEPKFPVHYTTNGIYFSGYRSSGVYLPPNYQRFEKGFPVNAAFIVEMPHNIYQTYWRGVLMSGTWGIYHPGQMTFDEAGAPNPRPNMVWSTDRYHGDQTPVGFWDGHVEVRRITPKDLPVQLLNPYYPVVP